MFAKFIYFDGVNVSHRLHLNKKFKSLLVCSQPVDRDVVFVYHFFELLGDLLFKFDFARLKRRFKDNKFFVKLIKEGLLLYLKLVQLIF